MICKPLNYKEDEASKPQCCRADGALLLSPKCISRPCLDRNCHECIWMRKKMSLRSTGAAGLVLLLLLLLMGSAVQHVVYKAAGLREGEAAACHLKNLVFFCFRSASLLHFSSFNGVVDTFPNKSPFSIFGLLLVIVSACSKSLFLSPSERAQS